VSSFWLVIPGKIHPSLPTDSILEILMGEGVKYPGNPGWEGGRGEWVWSENC